MRRIIYLFLALHLIPNLSFAADAATIIFKSGQVIKVDDGFRQVADAMKTLGSQENRQQIFELNIGGGALLINLTEIVAVCRDACANLTILHQLDPKRGGYKTKVEIDQAPHRSNPPTVLVK